MADSALSVGDDRIIAHLGFARAVASRSIDPRCRGADREDLIAWGLVGLVQAAGKLERLRTRRDASAQGRPTSREQTEPRDCEQWRNRNREPGPEDNLDGQQRKGDQRLPRTG